jgi:hypothetical protein
MSHSTKKLWLVHGDVFQDVSSSIDGRTARVIPIRGPVGQIPSDQDEMTRERQSECCKVVKAV